MKTSRSLWILSSLVLSAPFSQVFGDGHENWPTWRPTSGTGVAEHATPPIEWGDEKNIKWKAEIEGAGYSTPIVWEDKMFLLTAVPVGEAPAAPVAQQRGQRPGGNQNAAGGQGGRQRGGGQGGPGGQARGPGGPGGAGGPGAPNAELIAQFDKDGDGELNDDERNALRTEMRSRRGQGGPGAQAQGPAGRGRGQQAAGGGRRGGGGGRNAAPLQLHQFKVVALDRNSGEVIWEKLAKEEMPHEGHHPSHGYADASPITDGKHLYASFGSRGIFCYDLDGNLIWEKDLGDLRTRNGFGEAVSPALAGDKLIILWDQEDQSMIYALDKGAGEEVWSVERDERSSWTTPFIQEVDGTIQAIVAGTNATRSYDTENGNVIWEAAGLTSNVIPTPVVGHGNVYLTSGYQGNSVQAIKLTSKGDVSDSSDIVWSVRKSGSYVASPVLSGERLYVTKSYDNILSCMDAMTGDYHYQDQRLEALRGIYASPLAANGHLYVSGREGTTLVLKDSDNFEIVATNKLDDKIDASPIALGGDLFIRGHKYLYCISEG